MLKWSNLSEMFSAPASLMAFEALLSSIKYSLEISRFDMWSSAFTETKSKML